MSHRLFIATRPPANIRARLLALMEGVQHARWQSDAQLHLTLRFIGEVDRHTAEDIAAALDDIRDQPFTVSLNGAGLFDRKGRIDTLWVGVRPHEALAQLHRKIDHALVRIGLPAESRAYLPHITIARFGSRVGSTDDFMAAHGGLSGPEWTVGDFRLYESHLGNAGAHYESAARYRLG